MLTKRRRQAGDTIIEVLFATTVFSLVAVGGLSIMNQGTSMAQRALEIGLVRQQIDSQADALRYLNQSYIGDYGKRGNPTTVWNSVIASSATAQAQNFDQIVVDGKCQLPPVGSAFALDIDKLGSAGGLKLLPATIPGNFADVATYAKIRYDDGPAKAEGIWIQAVRSANINDRPGFYDFHIRACWSSPGQSTPVTLGTIVRLYEPRG